MAVGLPVYQLPSSLLPITTSTDRNELLNQARLLQLLHHRNKNQHRSSKWYSRFSQFRRQLHRVCDLLHLHHLESPAPPLNRSRSSNSKDTNHTQLRQQAESCINNMIQTDLIPKLYLSSTSLSKSPSFAPLSLTLLAIVARSCSLLAITKHYAALGRYKAKIQSEEEQKRLEIETDEETEEIAEALGRFASIDAVELFDNNIGSVESERDSSRGRERNVLAGDTRNVVIVNNNVPAAVTLPTRKRGIGPTPLDRRPRNKRGKTGNAIDDLFADL